MRPEIFATGNNIRAETLSIRCTRLVLFTGRYDPLPLIVSGIGICALTQSSSSLQRMTTRWRNSSLIQAGIR